MTEKKPILLEYQAPEPRRPWWRWWIDAAFLLMLAALLFALSGLRYAG
jgi:hypothetical protein